MWKTHRGGRRPAPPVPSHPEINLGSVGIDAASRKDATLAPWAWPVYDERESTRRRRARNRNAIEAQTAMTFPRTSRLGLLLALSSLTPASACRGGEPDDPQVGQSFRVPYRLSETNHFIVRARIDGKGPFNLVVDTGAPALFLSEDAARDAGLKINPRRYFGRIDRVEFEGGAAIEGVQVRIEDLYQIVGMNALGLPGVRIDGMLGFNVLARYAIEIDPTDDRMTWTRLDFEPPDMVEPGQRNPKTPPEVQAMGLLGGVAQLAAVFVGKQPEDLLIPRGFLGIELIEDGGFLRVAAVLPGSMAEAAGVEPGERLTAIDGRGVATLDDARRAVAEVEPGDLVRLKLASEEDVDGAEPRTIKINAGEGL